MLRKIDKSLHRDVFFFFLMDVEAALASLQIRQVRLLWDVTYRYFFYETFFFFFTSSLRPSTWLQSGVYTPINRKHHDFWVWFGKKKGLRFHLFFFSKDSLTSLFVTMAMGSVIPPPDRTVTLNVKDKKKDIYM